MKYAIAIKPTLQLTHLPPDVRERNIYQRRRGPNLHLHLHWSCTRLLTHQFHQPSSSLLIPVGESSFYLRTSLRLHHAHKGTEQQVNFIFFPNKQIFRFLRCYRHLPLCLMTEHHTLIHSVGSSAPPLLLLPKSSQKFYHVVFSLDSTVSQLKIEIRSPPCCNFL